MAQNTVKARLQLKNDTEINWNKAINFIPLKGEVIIYLPDDAHPFSRLKVGDGKAYVRDLPFIEANATVKTDTMENWNTKIDFIPDFGEIVVYIDYNIFNNINYPGVKVGDGNTFLIDLPFLNEFFDVQLQSHINDNSVHVTSEEKLFWNNKINCIDMVENDELILTRY